MSEKDLSRSHGPQIRQAYKLMSPEAKLRWKKNISESKMGKKNAMYGTISPFRGKHHTEETKNKLRLQHLGMKASKQTKKKMSKLHKGLLLGEKSPMWGKHLSAETKEKLRQSSLGRKHRPESIEKIRKANTGKKRTDEMKKRISLAKMGINTGKNHPNWKGGITLLYTSIRTSTTYNLWRKAVFIKDHFQCQDCGKISSPDMNAHHLHPFIKLMRDYDIRSVGQAIKTEELWDINNGITLCYKCHKKRHKLTKEREKLKTLGGEIDG